MSPGQIVYETLTRLERAGLLRGTRGEQIAGRFAERVAAYGARSAMSTAEARRRCPSGTAFLGGRFAAYRRTSDVVMGLLRELHARGLRFRVDVPVLADRRRRMDIVFGPSRVAVMVDGCFWHGCPTHATPRPAFPCSGIHGERDEGESTMVTNGRRPWRGVR